MEPTKKFIDIENVVRNKNERLAKWLPGFVINFIKRVVHEDDINGIMSRIGHTEGLEFVDGTLKELGVTVHTKGTENIPKKGGVILAANHPLGGLDGMAFMKAVGEVRTDFQFLVNDILLNIKNLAPLFVPVNKLGANPRLASKIIEESYSKDIAILVFPAGLVSRKLSGEVADLEWKKSFIARSIKYQKDIVPVHIEGENSSFFYNLARVRERLGLKNIEMMLLPREMFKQKGHTLTVTFGKPIPWTSFDKSKPLNHWAAEIREKVYALPQSKEQ